MAAAQAITVDLGCGAMPYRPLVSGWYLGLNLATSHGDNDALGAAEAAPLRDRCCDVVISIQQLEHVDSPVAVLQEAFRILRPGERLLLSTNGVWAHHPDPCDVWRWTEAGLARVVHDAGFDVDRVHHQGELFTIAILLATYPLGAVRRRGPRPIRAIAGTALVVANLVCRPLDALLR